MYILLISFVIFMICAVYFYFKNYIKIREREPKDKISYFILWLVISLLVGLLVDIVYPKNYGYKTEYYRICKVNSKYVDTTYGMVNCIFIKNNLNEFGNIKNEDCEIKYSNKIKIPILVIRKYEVLDNNIYILSQYELNKKIIKYTILLPINN